MTSRGRVRGALVGLLAVGALFAAETALADTRGVVDGNDRPGPLDIRAAGHGHAGSVVTHRITTFSRWGTRLLGPNTANLFALEISTDADAALERVVLIFSGNGRMRARVYRLQSGRLVFVGSASASKTNARTVRVKIRRSLLGNPRGYRWDAHSQYQAAGACRDFCIDKAPNSGRVLHDITAPRITFPAPLVVPQSTTYSIGFAVSDAGGSGLTWRVQHRPLGQQAWATVQSGTGPGTKTHQHVSAEDADDEYRIVARDGNGNTRISPIRLVSVPADDDDTDIVYADMWATTQASGAFLGSVTSSSDPGDTVTFQFTGRFVAWVAPGGGTGTASVSINGGAATDVDLSAFAGARQRVFTRTFSTAVPRTLTITVDTGPVAVDGFIVR